MEVNDIVSGDGIMALEGGGFGNLQATPPSPSHPIPFHLTNNASFKPHHPTTPPPHHRPFGLVPSGPGETRASIQRFISGLGALYVVSEESRWGLCRIQLGQGRMEAEVVIRSKHSARPLAWRRAPAAWSRRQVSGGG